MFYLFLILSFVIFNYKNLYALTINKFRHSYYLRDFEHIIKSRSWWKEHYYFCFYETKLIFCIRSSTRNLDVTLLTNEDIEEIRQYLNAKEIQFDENLSNKWFKYYKIIYD